VEELECTLLGLVARREEVLDRLLAEHHLAAAYNASVLVENKVLLGETTAGVDSRSVENLSLGSCSLHYIKGKDFYDWSIGKQFSSRPKVVG